MTGTVHRFADVCVVGAGTVGLDPHGRSVPDEALTQLITVRGARPLARAARLGLAASLLALGSDVLSSEPDPRAAITFGTRGASLLPLAEFAHVADTEGPARVFPMAFPNTVASVHAGYLATLLKRSGPALTLCGPGAGLEALLEGALLLDGGRVDDVLVVAADETLPGEASALGEGAAAVLLARCPAVLAPGAGVGHAAGRAAARLLAIAAADDPERLPQPAASDGERVRHLRGGLESVAHIASAAVEATVTVSGPLGVRGAASVLLAPLAR